MYLAMVTSPAGDLFVSLGSTKNNAILELAKAYKEFYDMTEENLQEEHGYDNFETYLDDYLGMNVYIVSKNEAVVCGYDVHYKNGKRVKGD